MLFKWFSRLLHTIVFLAFLFVFSHLLAPILVEASPISNIFINEIHYDNNGADINEYLEIAGDAGIDLTNWSLHLYNGKDGLSGKSFSLSDWSNTDNDIGFLTVGVKGIQNGSPDGIALFDGTNIIQFLSYEGSFTATSGVAIGLTSIDIGVFESSSTSLGLSLQLTGKGQQYNDFSWTAPQKSTFGEPNVKQHFIINKNAIAQVSEPNSLPLFLLVLLILSIRIFFSGNVNRTTYLVRYN